MITEEYGYSQANLFYQGDLWNYNTHYLEDDPEIPEDVEESVVSTCQISLARVALMPIVGFAG